MTSPPPRSRAPWIVAAVFGVIAGILAALLVALTWGGLAHKDKTNANPAFTSSEQASVDAAKQFVINQFTYSRASFDKDFARALAGATGGVKSDLSKNQAQLKSLMTAGGFDLAGSVTDSGLSSADGKGNVDVLVSATGYHVTSAGRVPATTARFKVTMTKIDGKWYASNLTTVGLV
jgi:Mce-associated membrane protein